MTRNWIGASTKRLDAGVWHRSWSADQDRIGPTKQAQSRNLTILVETVASMARLHQHSLCSQAVNKAPTRVDRRINRVAS
jgi:hypothetical protein